jgi:hypothetical protein
MSELAAPQVMKPRGRSQPGSATKERDAGDGESRLAVFRHPLVVGLALATLSGLLASLVIPGMTRVWQDRPNELALKEAIVERISQAATETIAQGSARFAAVDNINRRWMVESAGVASQLNTYFRDSSAAKEWKNFSEAVSQFVFYATASDASNLTQADDRRRDLSRRFAQTTFGNVQNERVRAAFAGAPNGFGVPTITELLHAWQDNLVTQILDSKAYGFSHGFWIFH